MRSEINGQFIRYVIVGLASNALIYFFYLVLTVVGLGPKLAMSFLYFLGVIQTFVLNKKWSFGYAGKTGPALIRYAMVYIAGYIINIVVLMLLVDLGGMPHQWVMGGLIFFMAVFFFIGQKFWVFRKAVKSELKS